MRVLERPVPPTRPYIEGSTVLAYGEPTVTLYRERPGTGLTRRERFTTAHELGHVALALDGSASTSPVGRAAERFCDAFASRLLVADGDLPTRQPGARSSTWVDELALALCDVSARCAVSLPVVAARVLERETLGAVVGLDRSGSVRWVRSRGLQTYTVGRVVEEAGRGVSGVVRGLAWGVGGAEGGRCLVALPASS